MKRLTAWLLYLSFLLVLTGFIGHEVIPHHHHSTKGDVHACCESHGDDDPTGKTETPCTILSNIRFENNKPNIQVFSQELKHKQKECFFASCGISQFFTPLFTQIKTPIFIPQAVFSETRFYSSFSHRGPPLT